MSTPLETTRKETTMNQSSRFLITTLLVSAAAFSAYQAFGQQVENGPPAASQPGTPEAAYLAQNDAAMDKMMADMETKPSGDVDQDFVAMMTPHHQGAIDMALAVLKYGKNEQLRRIAQEIIVEQQQEIVAMKVAIGAPLPPSYAASTQIAPETADPPTGSMKAMHPNMKM
jgi:uncharacterized protein (DUF305 family)